MEFTLIISGRKLVSRRACSSVAGDAARPQLGHCPAVTGTPRTSLPCRYTRSQADQRPTSTLAGTRAEPAGNEAHGHGEVAEDRARPWPWSRQCDRRLRPRRGEVVRRHGWLEVPIYSSTHHRLIHNRHEPLRTRSWPRLPDDSRLCHRHVSGLAYLRLSVYLWDRGFVSHLCGCRILRSTSGWRSWDGSTRGCRGRLDRRNPRVVHLLGHWAGAPARRRAHRRIDSGHCRIRHVSRSCRGFRGGLGCSSIRLLSSTPGLTT